MKQLTFGIVCSGLVALVVMGALTVQGRMARQNDLDDNLSTAALEVLTNLCESGDYCIEDEEELVADFCQSLIQEISIGTDEVYDENQTITVEVAGVDVAKGLLSLRVTETYTHPNGSIGTLVCDVTGVFEEQQELKAYTLTYLVEDELYVGYSVTAGGEVRTPTANPKVEGKTFVGWQNVATGELLQEGATVESDLTFAAVFK